MFETMSSVVYVAVLIIGFCVLIYKASSEKRNPRDIPKYRGTYYSKAAGGFFDDMRTDNEVREDNKRARP